MGKLDFLSDYILLLAVLILSYFSYLLICRLLVSFINKYIRSNKVRFDDFIIESGTFKRLSFIVPVLILYNLVFIFPSAKEIIRILCNTLLIWIVILSISALLKGFNNYYESKPKSKMRPIKGYIQIINIIVYIIGIIIFIAMVTGESPMAILGGIGAMTAVLILIFRDTILSFVSSLQISGYDLVHKGDWIEMPKYGADGDVIDIALHTIKVQNWDKTITIIPTSKLIEDGFKNWRGMTQSGGRRIKRAVNIDVSSIKFCDQDMTVKFEKMRIITDYVKAKKDELEKYNRENNINETLPVNGRRMTNIGIFRAYAAAYLKNHPKINRNLTCMVRQLAPGAEGLPVEIYAFTNETEWLKYESIQADIFDHLLSILPHFDLRVFQYPSGMDIRNINNHSSA
ncbi:MAG: mechanosensitive ion channel [Spirochaetes bacterium]|nr:mechanosensitive ion channel [Spirochaetota bacterium]